MLVKRITLNKEIIISILIMYLFMYLTLLNNNNNIEIQYRINKLIGLDGINIPLILLTSIIYPIILIIREKYNKENNKWYKRLIILTELILILLFINLDMIYFYTLFELILIPLFILIIKYGSRFKKYEAGYKIYIYTFLGSIPLLLSILFFYLFIGSTYNELLYLSNIKDLTWLLFLIIIPLLIKVPMYPLHLWLPEAHTEASTTGSIILASIILKLGIFGIYRYILPLFNYLYILPLIITFSLLSILHSAFIALRLFDLKKIIAYSSIIHMNIVIIGMFISNMNSIIGSMYISISHGIISTSLFILIGILYRRYKTKIILYYRGLSNIMILFSIFFFIMIISNVSFPLTSGFIGELLLLIGIQNYSIITSLLILLGLLITTAFNFKILIKLLFGRLSIYIKKYKDLTINEFLSLFPLLLLNLILGIYCLPLIKLSYLSLLKLL